MKIVEIRCDGCGERVTPFTDKVMINGEVIASMGNHANYTHEEKKGEFVFCTAKCITDWLSRELKMRRDFHVS